MVDQPKGRNLKLHLVVNQPKTIYNPISNLYVKGILRFRKKPVVAREKFDRWCTGKKSDGLIFSLRVFLEQTIN